MAYNPKYDDIIDHPHHVPRSHPRMPLSDRAFQFAPFAALSGYADTIRETQRLTERKIELDEGTIEMLNRRCRRLMDTLDSRPTASITYFRPDERKEGGAYLTVTGVVRKLDPAARRIIMQDGTVIPAAEISGENYRAVRIGTVTLNDDICIFIAPVVNPAVRNVWIDRIILIPRKSGR